MVNGVDNRHRKPTAPKNTGYRMDQKPRTKKLVPPPEEFRLTREEVEQQIKDNAGMIGMVASEWFKTNRDYVTFLDLYQESVAGWLYAATVFDKRIGVKFSTYATYWAIATVRKYVRAEQARGLHVPSQGARPLRLKRLVSTSLPCGMEKDGTIGEMIADRQSLCDPEFPDDFWDRVNKHLQANERTIIDMRYRRAMTGGEIASIMNVTRQRIQQIEDRALKKIARLSDFGDCLGSL